MARCLEARRLHRSTGPRWAAGELARPRHGRDRLRTPSHGFEFHGCRQGLGASLKVSTSVYEHNASTIPFPACLVLQVLDTRCALIYTLSKGSGASPDSPPTLLQLLTAGAALSAAREGRARAWEAYAAATGQVLNPGLLERLRDPLLIVGLPRGWKTEKENPEVEEKKSSRVWSFAYTDDGIRINRSEALTISKVIDFVRAGVYA